MTNLEWGETVDGWRLATTLDKQVFTVEEPILLTVVVQNTSAKSQVVDSTGGEHFRLDCRRCDGEPVAPNAWGRRSHDAPAKQASASVAAGQTFVTEIAITRRLDLTLPGVYTLAVSRAIPTANTGGASMTSKACRFEVIE